MDKEKADTVIMTCMEEGLPLQLSKLVACQSCCETGNWTNHNFLKNNNGFGYKFFAKSDYQLKEGGIKSTEDDNYAAYASFADSVKEVCAWIKRRQRKGQFPADLVTIQLPEQYAYLLKVCGYYGGKETDYAKGIAYNMEKLNSDIA